MHDYLTQTKSAREHTGRNKVVKKRIQGGVQPDIALRVTSNFAWTSLQLTLHGCKSKKQLQFCVEMEHGSKLWSEPAHACIVRSWKHKEYTSVRVQFCREYYGQKIQFKARIGNLSATTETPIVLTHGNSWRGVVCIYHSQRSDESIIFTITHPSANISTVSRNSTLGTPTQKRKVRTKANRKSKKRRRCLTKG